MNIVLSRAPAGADARPTYRQSLETCREIRDPGTLGAVAGFIMVLAPLCIVLGICGFAIYLAASALAG